MDIAKKLYWHLLENKKKKPLAIIANTIKGKGITFMENNPEWHHKKVDKETIKKFELILEKWENNLSKQ